MAIWPILVFFLLVLVYALLWKFPLPFWTWDPSQTSPSWTPGPYLFWAGLPCVCLKHDAKRPQEWLILIDYHYTLGRNIWCFLYYWQVFLSFGHWFTGEYIYIFFFFLAVPVACGILVPWPEMDPVPPALEALNLKYWIIREVPTGIHQWADRVSCISESMGCLIPILDWDKHWDSPCKYAASELTVRDIGGLLIGPSSRMGSSTEYRQ